MLFIVSLSQQQCLGCLQATAEYAVLWLFRLLSLITSRSSAQFKVHAVTRKVRWKYTSLLPHRGLCYNDYTTERREPQQEVGEDWKRWWKNRHRLTPCYYRKYQLSPWRQSAPYQLIQVGLISPLNPSGESWSVTHSGNQSPWDDMIWSGRWKNWYLWAKWLNESVILYRCIKVCKVHTEQCHLCVDCS